MKHGMLTVRREPLPTGRSGAVMPMTSGEHAAAGDEMAIHDTADTARPGSDVKAAMTVFTFVVLAAALSIVVQFAM